MFILSPILPGSLYILLMQARERHVVTTSAQDFYSAVATTTKTLIYILSYGICPAWPRSLALDLSAINVEPLKASPSVWVLSQGGRNHPELGTHPFV